MHGTWTSMHTAVGIGPIDTDLQLSTDAWMPGRAGLLQPHQEHPESKLAGRSSDRPQPSARPTQIFDPETR